jgi:hypothetical protein
MKPALCLVGGLWLILGGMTALGYLPGVERQLNAWQTRAWTSIAPITVAESGRWKPLFQGAGIVCVLTGVFLICAAVFLAT